MAGIPKFDREEVLLRAAREFADRGYEGASVSRLVAATGLLRGSLYGAFGSKAELFQRAFAEAVERADPDLTIDLLTVALRERAQADAVVAGLVRAVLATLDRESGSAGELIFGRLVRRAGLSPHHPKEDAAHG